MTELNKLYEEISILLERNATQPETGGAKALSAYGDINNAEKELSSIGKDKGWEYQGYKKTDAGRRIVFLYKNAEGQWGYFTETGAIQPYNKGVDPSKDSEVASGLKAEPAQETEPVEQPVAQPDAPAKADAPVEKPVEEPIENDAPESKKVEEEDPPKYKKSKQPEMGSGNTELNNNSRFKDVIDNPAIAKAIDAAQKPIQSIDFVTSQDGNQVVLMGESLESPIEVPYFISRFMESEAIGAPLGAGKATSLNAFMTADVRDQLEKAGKSVTKIFLDSDGKAWFLDDKGSPIMLDKPEDHASQSDGTKEGAKEGAISNAIKQNELVNISEQINKKIENLTIGVNNSLAKNNAPIKVNSIKLGNAIEGTYLKESILKEAENTEGSSKEEKENTKKESPKNIPSGAEFYIISSIGLGTAKGQRTKGLVGQTLNNVKQGTVDTAHNLFGQEYKDKTKKGKNSNEDTSENNAVKEEDFKKYLEAIPEAICNVLNNLGIKVSSKVKDEGVSFTGQKNVEAPISFQVGSNDRVKIEGLESDDNGMITSNEVTFAFTVIAKKGSSKDKGNFLNKLAGGLARAGGMINDANKYSAQKNVI